MYPFITILLLTLGVFIAPNFTLLAQLPPLAPEKTKAELIRDIQSAAPGDTASEAVKSAVLRHDLATLTMGLLNSQYSIKRLCLQSLNSFSVDQQKVALRTNLLNNDAWQVLLGSAAGTTQFEVGKLFAEKLKEFSITVEPSELYSKAARDDIAKRLTTGDTQ